MKRHLLALAAILSSAFLVLPASSGCAGVPAAGSIIVTYSALGSLVKDLVGNQADIIVSIPNGLDPHTWAPSARDIEAINKARLVIQNGLGLESGMQKTLAQAQLNGVKFFTASDYITIRHVGPGEGVPSGDPDQTLGAPDPHLWTDPLAMKSIIAALSDYLKVNLGINVDSKSAILQSQLETLNQQITTMVSVLPTDGRKLVTGHESMGYFAARYGFTLIGALIPSLSDQADVSVADLAALKQDILSNGVGAIFTELGTSAVVINQIGKETGAKVVQLSTHVLPADGSYFTFETNLAQTIVDALK